MRISVQTEKCTGCRTCELVCYYSKSELQRFNPKKSRIRVVELDHVGFTNPVVCILCNKPRCVEACTRGALSKTAVGTISVAEEKCDGCGNCVNECIIGAINFDEEKGLPMICNLCNGTPACVAWCPTGTLTFDKGADGRKKRLNYTLTKVKPLLSKRKLPQEMLKWYRKFT